MRKGMNVKELGPGAILVFLNLKNNRNMVLNGWNSKGGMKLGFGGFWWGGGLCHLAGITARRLGVLFIVVYVIGLRHLTMEESSRMKDTVSGWSDEWAKGKSCVKPVRGYLDVIRRGGRDDNIFVENVAAVVAPQERDATTAICGWGFVCVCLRERERERERD